MRLVKCNKCGEQFPKETLIYINSNTKYCTRCKAEIDEFRSFTDELKRMYGDNAPYGFIVKKAKDLVNTKGMTYQQIYLIMDYMLRIEGKKLTEDLILLVPNYYNPTVRLYEDKAKFNTSLSKIINMTPLETYEVKEVSKVIPKTDKIIKVNIEDL